MKQKTSTKGGSRPNSGRKQTGRNTQTISFSVHKDFVEVIRATVKAKTAELKELQKKANDKGELTVTFHPKGKIKQISK